MPQFSTIARWLHPTVASLATLTGDYFQSLFQKAGLDGWYLLGPLATAIVAMALVDWLASQALERFRFIRMLIAGDNDIEGDWVVVAMDGKEQSAKIVAVEYTRIRYCDGEYLVAGQTWGLDGVWQHSFESEGARLQGRRLEFSFKQGSGANPVGGHSTIRFTPQDPCPSRFVCDYIDGEAKAWYHTRGMLASRWHQHVPDELRRELALKFAKAFLQSNSPIEPLISSPDTPRPK